MSKRIPKTTGTEWLYLSMASFNGSGYADKGSAEGYVYSYRLFKAWKKKKEAIEILDKFPVEAMSYAEKLIQANEAGMTPSDKNLAKFEAFCERAGLL
jgi:hypothetical protein